MKSHWVEHKGKKVFIAEFSNFGTDSSALLAEAGEILQVLTREPPNSVLVVSNVAGTIATAGNLEVLQHILPVSNYFVKKRAVTGVSGARKAFLDFFVKLTGKTSLTPFDTIEEALDFVVQES